MSESQPYLRQWWDETKNFKVAPGKTAIGKVANGLGKVAVGATTLVDRTIDKVSNPKPPEYLRSTDLLPRTQRDIRQLARGLFSRDAVDHPLKTAVSTVSRVWGIGTSAVIDGVQILGGGKK